MTRVMIRIRTWEWTDKKMEKWEHYDDNINLANDSDNYGGDDD